MKYLASLLFVVVVVFCCCTFMVQAQTRRDTCATIKSTSSTLTFSDHYFFANYDNNRDCYWLLQPTNAAQVRLMFTAFATEKGADLVTIYNGADTTAKILGVFSGNALPPSVVSTGGAMLVRFTTNAKNRDLGWTATYSTSFILTTDTVTTFSDHEGSFEEYDNNVDNYWLIKPTGSKQIRLTFSSFSTEGDYDIVTIYNGADTTAQILGVFSGNALPPSVVSTGGTMLVRFTTDGYNPDLGWTATYFSSSEPVTLRTTPSVINFSAVTFGNVTLDSFTLSGSNLPLQGNFRIAVPTGFRIALKSTGPFVDTLIIANTTKEVNNLTIFLQFTPLAPGDYSGRIFIWNGTGIANIPVSGFSPPAIYWEPSNGPFSGNVQTLSIGAGNTVIAGTYGGVFRTNSGGAAWIQSNDGLNNANARYINASLATSTGMFVGTEQGIFRSLDRGRTWQPSYNGIAPKDSVTTVQALGGVDGTIVAGTSRGIFVSYDNGSSWAELDTASNTTAILLYKSKDVRENDQQITEYTLLVADHEGYIYQTKDFGENWETGFAGSDSYVTCFALNGTTPFAGTLGEGVYAYSNDNADKTFQWQPANGGFPDDYSYYVRGLSASNNVIYAATDAGVMRSNDNGKTWAKSNKGITEPYANAVVANGLEVYVGTDAGVFRSVNQGGSWSSVNTGLAAATVTAMKENRGTVFAGTTGSGIFRSQDNGITWVPSNNGLRARFVNAFAPKNRDIFAAAYDEFTPTNPLISPGIFRSLDNGASWTKALEDTTIFDSNNGGRYHLGFFSLLSTSRGIFAGGEYGRIWRSTDNGFTWSSAASLKNVLRDLDYSVSCLASGSGNSIFAGTGFGFDFAGRASDGFGIYRSDNDGATWTDVSADFYPGSETTYALLKKDTYLFAATSGGLYRTRNNGRTWDYLQKDNTAYLPDSVTVVSLYTNGGVVYAGTSDAGVWRTLNDGESWGKVSDGIASDADVYSLASGGGTDLYAGLGGSTIFRSSLQLPVNSSRAFFEIPDTLTAAPGDTVSVPIILSNIQSRPPGSLVVTTTLRFNASLLYPAVKQGLKGNIILSDDSLVVSGDRLIPLQITIPSSVKIGDAIDTLKFSAALGNSVATPLTLTSLASGQGVVLVAQKPGIFTLRGLSEAGGTRLFYSERAPLLAPSSPNPVDNVAVVKFEITTAGQTLISVVNVFGQTVKTLQSANMLPGEYEIPLNAADMPPGAYFIVLQTPRYRVTQQVHVIR